GVHDAAVRPVQSRPGRVATVPTRALPSPRHRGDDVRLRVEAAHGVVLGVHDVDVALLVAADGLGSVERRLRRVTAVAAVALGPGARQRRDDAVGVDLAHRVALALADEGVADAVHAHGAGADEHRLRGRAAVADAGAVHPVLGFTGAGEGGDEAGLQ